MTFSVVLGLVLLVFAVKVVQIQQRNRRGGKRVKEGLDEPVTFAARAQVKYVLGAGLWSTKTLGGMELAVRQSWIEVRTQPTFVGSLLGNYWCLAIDGCSMRIERLSSDPLGREWIVLSGNDAARGALRLAILPKQHVTDSWHALVAAGVKITDTPNQ
jgi:hypothetical protein